LSVQKIQNKLDMYELNGSFFGDEVSLQNVESRNNLLMTLRRLKVTPGSE